MDRILIAFACGLLTMPACKEASVNDNANSRRSIKITDMTYPMRPVLPSLVYFIVWVLNIKTVIYH